MSYRPFCWASRCGGRHVISARPSPAHPATAMTAQDLIAHATVLACRLAGYALQNMAEDAALLAMMFC